MAKKVTCDNAGEEYYSHVSFLSHRCCLKADKGGGPIVESAAVMVSAIDAAMLSLIFFCFVISLKP